VVIRMLSTVVSLSSERDIISYMHELDSKIGSIADFPVFVRDENELSRILCAIKW